MADNAEQIADWNGPLGERWAELQSELDAFTGPFGEAALAVAAVGAGEQVLDIGCGCGDTTLTLARAVGSGRGVTGVDVSAPMLAVAERRRVAAGIANAAFRLADAARADLPTGLDLIFSRFGMMFFDAPVAAMTHLRRSMAAGGRMVFCCWRHPRENPWAMAPVAAARAALNIVAPAADLTAPGPFAFSDRERLVGLLEAAGWTTPSIDPFDTKIRLGATAAEAALNASRWGPVSRVLREAGDEATPLALPAIATALAPYAGDAGVMIGGAVWIVTARAGA